MLRSLSVLIALQLAGEMIARGARLPVPGPVIGMVLLFVALVVRDRLGGTPPTELARTADGLLAHLSLLFVPAGVGVMVLLPALSQDALPIALALVASTVLAIAVTALVMRLASGDDGGPKDGVAASDDGPPRSGGPPS